jgi:hypothetical protein
LVFQIELVSLQPLNAMTKQLINWRHHYLINWVDRNHQFWNASWLLAVGKQVSFRMRSSHVLTWLTECGCQWRRDQDPETWKTPTTCRTYVEGSTCRNLLMWKRPHVGICLR